MKRLVTRIAVLSGAGALGMIAMACAQWGSQPSTSQANATPAPGPSAARGEPPDPWTGNAPGADPYAAQQKPDRPMTSAAAYGQDRLSQAATGKSFGSTPASDSNRSGVHIRQVNLQSFQSDETGNGSNSGGGSGAASDPFSNMPPPISETGQGAGSTTMQANPSNKSGAGGAGGKASGNPLRANQKTNELALPGAGTNDSFSGAFNKPSTNQPPGSGGRSGEDSGLHRFSSNAASAPPNEFPPIAPGRDGLVRPMSSAAGGAGTPGAQQLEGSQRPNLTIQKLAPPEIQVNKICTFEIHVRNTGEVAARDVEIFDRVPKGTHYVGSVPPAEQSSHGELVWRIESLPPGDQRAIKLQLRPLARGEIGSVATVRFSADASVRSKCTSPELHVELAATRQTLIGDSVPLTIKVTNIGDGAATGVVIKEQVPDKFDHPQGQTLENELGTLKPQESRELKLTLRATKPGTAANRLIVTADGELRVEKELPLEVVAPALAVGVQGPEQRILEREAVYMIALENPGSAPAKVVQLSAYVPPGFKFIGANNHGVFDPKTRRVAWELVELPPGENDRVELKLLPIEAGLHELVIEGRAQRNVQATHKFGVNVDGVVNIQFQVDQPPTKSGALEVGGEAVYEIRVANNGSKPATNLVLTAVFPPGLQGVGGKGPVSATAGGDRVVFAQLPRLAPRADTTFHVIARAQNVGDQRVKFQVQAAELRDAITKDVSTPVQ